MSIVTSLILLNTIMSMANGIALIGFEKMTMEHKKKYE